MIDWYLETIAPGDSDDMWAMLALQPVEHDMHDALGIRLRRAGCKYLTPREYQSIAWAQSTCTVTVQEVDGAPHVTELHTGASRIMPTERCSLPPMFAEAAGRGRILLALVAPATLPTYGLGRTFPAETREHLGEQMESAVGQLGRVLGGFARVLGEPAPRPSPTSRAGRRPSGYR